MDTQVDNGLKRDRCGPKLHCAKLHALFVAKPERAQLQIRTRPEEELLRPFNVEHREARVVGTGGQFLLMGQD